ncbi:MAG TPA: glycine oxidase ThiO [Solirubrobacteraceae bacterium]|nr:glycine oxidase ThiO [Solirubrobacteraceae bacterium]
MSVEQAKPDVAVVGGGPIGLASAWRAVQRGLRVTVLDAGDPGAWHVAAGMLAPVAEANFGEDALLDLSLRAAAGYPAFCAELAEASGVDPGLRRTGTLVVARDRDEAESLDRLLAFRRRLGLDVERLLPTAARRAEPALAPTVRLALDIAGDHSVDPRRLVAALAEAVRRAGGSVRAGARVTELATDGDRVTGVTLEDGSMVEAGAVLVAAGAHAGRFGAVPVRPVKGQVVRLRDPSGPGLVERTIRTHDAYLVPRADGRYVVGATMEERGFDTAPTAGGVFELLRDVSEVVPGVLELELEDVLAGLRPATPDNLPAIGRGALDGLVWATGSFRNGILLSGLTGELAAAAICGEELPHWAAPADPARFETTARHAAITPPDRAAVRA